MPAVLVHGVPDTHRVWARLLEVLDRDDVITPSLPGFGCPRPDGFAATKEAYVDWLLDELRGIEGPIDLVGHDWGALLVFRVVSLEPDIVRTWAGGAAPVDREYEWHPTAQLWQTPEVGEQVIEAMAGPTLVDGLTGVGVPADDAAVAAEHFDEVMGSCILDLYRSAVTVGDEWQDDLTPTDAPGLVLWGAEDPYAPSTYGARMADRLHAEFAELACGHWWQLEAVEATAQQLERHWADAEMQE